MLTALHKRKKYSQDANCLPAVSYSMFDTITICRSESDELAVRVSLTGRNNEVPQS
jgi:hypothetical protein